MGGLFVRFTDSIKKRDSKRENAEKNRELDVL